MAFIKVEYSRQPYAADLQSYNLKVEVLESEGVPASTPESGPEKACIFVMQRLPDGNDRFLCVADPVDMLDYPENAPDLGEEMPYFRVDTVELVFRSYEAATDTRNDIAYDISKLVKSINAQGEYPESEEVTYA